MRKLVSIFFALLFLLSFCVGLVTPEVISASDNINEALIQKITRDYTKKFCNSIAFGISKESALEFSNNENNLIFKNRKGIDSLNQEIIANRIATSVIEKCGYNIQLNGEEGINQFSSDYIEMNNFLLKDNLFFY